jgi:ATP-dependent DNA ligase
MSAPLRSPILPMLAKRVEEIPLDANPWSFEPKWDGFRAVIFRNHDELLIQSRDGKPLDRYFPELREPLLNSCPNSAFWMAKSSSQRRAASTLMR